MNGKYFLPSGRLLLHFVDHFLCCAEAFQFDLDVISHLVILLLVSNRCRVAQLASIRQMSGQVSRGSAGEYKADERAGVARLSWRVSGR